VDTKLFQPSRHDFHGKERRVIFVGRLDPVKNLSMLIEALALIKDHLVRLVLVGEGPLRESLKEQAGRLGLQCEFTGVVQNEAVPELLNDADMFVLPSFREGNPKVLLEAMSCGLPCVGTDVEGIREVIQDGENGLLCDLTPQDLADKICSLLSDQDLALKLSQEARRYVLANFDLDHLLEKESRYLYSLAVSRYKIEG
jgi:glycosyltransferase involved in cell wall biosynthesis